MPSPTAMESNESQFMPLGYFRLRCGSQSRNIRQNTPDSGWRSKKARTERRRKESGADSTQ